MPLPPPVMRMVLPVGFMWMGCFGGAGVAGYARTSVAPASMSATVTASMSAAAVAAVAVTMASVRGAVDYGAACSATSEEDRIGGCSVASGVEGAGVQALCLLYRIGLLPGATEDMWIVMDHAAKEPVAIVRIFGCIEDVLMPELIEVILPICSQPRYEHEARFHLKQGEEADVFRAGGFCSLQAPSLLFHQGIADGVEVDCFGDIARLRGGRSLQSGIEGYPHD